ncbi:MAG TPA: PilT/PilU family type 4a pilus ATPase [Terriglobales bacterium]|nr:PilT/PilU family type 4a pilus ATPase [Terriglobales bacterium]
MATPGIAPIAISIDAPGSGAATTHDLLTAVLRANEQISDLIFSPGRPPQIEVHGQLIPIHAPGLESMTPDDTRRIASDLIGNNKQAINILREQGSCDISYGLPGMARFRVNVFIQRGSCAIVMRVIPTAIPDFAALNLPLQLKEIANLRKGIVLVAGHRGSGKSSTLATLLDCINEQQVCHIITIEDPIEFLHKHKRATIHQRELHIDTPSFSSAMKSALRQAPKVILVGELRDRETTERVIEAAETGHIVLSTVNSVNAPKTIERLTSGFSGEEQKSIRTRLAKNLSHIISQRLLPRKDGRGRVAAIEIFKLTPRTSGVVECEDPSGHNIFEAIKTGASEGMQHFDGEIEKLVRKGIVDVPTALTHASDAHELKHVLSDFRP